MENSESLNPERSKRILTILKFAVTLLLIPVIYALTVCFVNEAKLIGSDFINVFVQGIIAFLVFYLFIYEPAKFYKQGQKITEKTTRFFSPLFKIAPFVIPIYSILLFLSYGLVSLFTKSQAVLHSFLFLIGFSFIFHLVFSAKALRSRRNDFLMTSYLFSFFFVYIITVSVVAAGFTVIFKDFSWFNFCKHSWQATGSFYYVVFSQLFL